MKRQAIIDLGTNTFQLVVAEMEQGNFKILHDSSLPAKIGEGGISEGKISDEGIRRAIGVLKQFRQITDEYNIEPEKITALGTSAIRNASNQAEFSQRVLEETGITVTIIKGEEEAGLIYEGVKAGMKLRKETSLIVDIGGGSVEFILCNNEKLFWKQSFEIGGQRLMDRFNQTDPILPDSISKLNEYLEQQLVPLTNAVHQYEAHELIGSAGSFETLLDIHSIRETGELPDLSLTSGELPLASFIDSYEKFITSDHDQRLEIPGMKAYRADMIVVASCLIAFLLRKYGLKNIRVSMYAMKEGLLSRMSKQES
ncbi:phosphatase [Siphonobacter sp. SORGH_AS_1065]|uniref:Ppx/GppA phosphatase family protein n=1 Tax=Siphonobacter sp. SORGH_AS_1065 TaxID=3041795 RepID=UPI0027894062|nr:phosphatase [Siphonobacter sp. SORGH_AS_1065]MDQ1088269.1 exopolyphosphatase/guanosine-5'-triphosphate,3'-diphosphate pyrophosphatase [Siphonobacter sp. SORGH_AS_1065]